MEMTQDIVDELLESMRSGKPPQILFGRTPVRVIMFLPSLPCIPSPMCSKLALHWVVHSRSDDHS